LAVPTIKTERNRIQRAEVGGQRSEDRRQKIEEESIVERRAKAAINCTGRRTLGESSTLSPKKLNKARKVAGSQKLAGILRTNEDKTKAARMPIPPPFGTTPS
jgi:hypothetical protein